MTKCGVILAGGNSTRWGGYPKELLPIANGTTLLQYAVDILYGMNVNEIAVVTSAEKRPLHNYLLGDSVRYFDRKDSNIFRVIAESFVCNADMYYFVMPDTLVPPDAFQNLQNGHFNIGYFETDKPERFGVITEHGIVDKTPFPPGSYKAWGILSWDREVVDFWKKNFNKINSHTCAFNMAINEFNFTMSRMEYYFDMASFEDYARYLCNPM